MQPFAIYCTTCKARLRVTDPSFIGQILACPKCESMVLVEPPPAAASAPSAVSKPAVVSGASSVVLQGPIPVTPPPLPTVAPPPMAPSKAVPSVQPVGAASNAAAPVAPAKLPRDWTLFAGGIAVGVVFGVAIWLLVAMRNTGDESVAIASANAAPMDSIKQPPTTPDAELAKTSNEPTKAPVEERPKPVEALKPVVAEPAIQPAVELEKQQPDVAVAEPVKVAEPAPPAVVEPAADPPAPESAPKESVAEPKLEPADADQPVDGDDPAVSPAEPKSPITDPQLAELNVRLPKVAFDKVPLRQFVAFAADASGAKIVIDYRTLRAAGFKSPTVTARASDCTLGELLQESLDKIGLSFETRDGAIVIFAP